MRTPVPLRLAVGLLAGGAVGALGALVAGEYELGGMAALVAGAAIGATVGETVRVVGRAGPAAMAGAAVLAGGATLWAGWIDAGRGLEAFPAMVWPGAAAGAAVAGWRGRSRQGPTALRG